MSPKLAFDEVLDAAEQLDIEAQTELVEIMTRRLAERGRERIAISVAQARQEFLAGQYEAMTAAEIVREATS